MERKIYPPAKGNWTSYRVFYYSIRRKITDYFDFKIDLSTTPNRIVARGWYEQKEEEAYWEGEGANLPRKNIYCVNLNDPDKGIPFRIMFLNDGDIVRKSFLWGILSGVDLYHLPISCEVILLKASDLDANPSMEAIARQILMVRKAYLKIENEGQGIHIRSVADIPIRTETIKELAYLAGKKYLIWGIYKKGVLFQSILTIDEHLECTLKTELGSPYQEQQALLDVSSVNFKRIQITTIPKTTNNGLICGWLITKSPNEISTGAFFHCGNTATTPFAGYIALLEIDQTEQFVPEDNISLTNIKTRINANPKLMPLYNKLKMILDSLDASGIELPAI